MPKGGRSEQDEFGTDFGRNPSIGKRAAYAAFAVFPVLLPAFLFVRLYVLDLAACKVTLAAGVIVGCALLSVSYHNLAFSKAARVRAVVGPPSKGAFKGKKAEHDQAVAMHDAKVESAAFVYSYFYNNLIFLLGVAFVGAYLINDKVSGDLSFVISSAVAAGLAVFNSKSALKAIGES